MPRHRQTRLLGAEIRVTRWVVFKAKITPQTHADSDRILLEYLLEFYPFLTP